MTKTHPTWLPILQSAFNDPAMLRLSNSIKSQRLVKTIYPDAEDVLRVFGLGIPDIKVVIIGQDPYPHDAADGLAFSSKSGFVPESLSRIFDAIEEEFGFVIDQDPNLERLKEQGVFLYNPILTVEKGIPLSHMNMGWERFSSYIIRVLNEKTENVVWIIWGKHSQVFVPMIDQFRHKIIVCEHPVAGKYQGGRPWKNNKCFTECNNYLEQYDRGTISWAIPN